MDHLAGLKYSKTDYVRAIILWLIYRFKCLTFWSIQLTFHLWYSLLSFLTWSRPLGAFILYGIRVMTRGLGGVHGPTTRPERVNPVFPSHWTVLQTTISRWKLVAARTNDKYLSHQQTLSHRLVTGLNLAVHDPAKLATKAVPIRDNSRTEFEKLVPGLQPAVTVPWAIYCNPLPTPAQRGWLVPFSWAVEVNDDSSHQVGHGTCQSNLIIPGTWPTVQPLHSTNAGYPQKRPQIADSDREFGLLQHLFPFYLLH